MLFLPQCTGGWIVQSSFSICTLKRWNKKGKELRNNKFWWVDCSYSIWLTNHLFMQRACECIIWEGKIPFTVSAGSRWILTKISKCRESFNGKLHSDPQREPKAFTLSEGRRCAGTDKTAQVIWCLLLCLLLAREVREAVDNSYLKPEDFQERQVCYNDDLIFWHPTLPFFIFSKLCFVTQLLIPFI